MPEGIDTNIGTPFEVGLSNVPCISCGQCTAVCPTGALVEKDDTDKVWAALADPTKHVVVQTAPSIRATLGECFDMPIGTRVTGKMVSAIRALGAEPVIYPARNECCGGYIALEDAESAKKKSNAVANSALNHGADMIVTACPLCKYNLVKCGADIPVVYFTELLAEALGVKEDTNA